MKKPLLGLAGLFCLCISISQVSAATTPKPLAIPGNFNGFTTSYYATDTNVFYHTCEGDGPDCFILVPDADPKTFTMVADKNSVTPGIAYFAKDAKHVYVGYTVLPLADPNTFTLIDSSFARDARHIYYNANLLRGVNARTFKKLSTFYATDGKKVVYMDKILLGAKARSFKVVVNEKNKKVRYNWGYDEANVFYEHKIMKGLNPKTLTVFSPFIAKDDHAVYCSGKPLKNVDASSFERLNEYYAKDKNHGYTYDLGWIQPPTPCKLLVVKDADPATLKAFVKGKVMYDNLAVDSTHVFSDGEIIPNADPKNFDPDAWYEKLEEESKGHTKTGAGDQ